MALTLWEAKCKFDFDNEGFNSLEIEAIDDLHDEIGLNEFGVDGLEMVKEVIDGTYTIEELHNLAIEDEWDDDYKNAIPTQEDVEWFENEAREYAIKELLRG